MNSIENSLLRFAAIAGVLASAIIVVLGLAGIGGLVLPVLLGVTVGIGGLVLFCWAGTRFITHLFHGDNPEYRQWLRKHNDPWFATLPPPFKAPQSEAPYYCLRCHGDMWETAGVCPACGYGQNEMVCPCGVEVRQPCAGAFESTGVRCPSCLNVLKR